MEKHQITQSLLSRETGISPASISRIQNNHATRVDFNTLNTLAKYFDIKSGDELLEYVIED